MEAPAEVVIRRLQTVEEGRTCARMMAESEPWLTLRRSFDDNLKLILDPAKEAYVAVAGDSPIGIVLLHLHGPLNGYLQAIAVMPESRKAGIGLKLIHFAEERIFQASPNAFLCVSSFSLRSRATPLRPSRVRAQVGEVKDYIVKGHSEILIRKTLRPQSEFTAPIQGVTTQTV